jgi:Fe-S cluster assembly protein SufD
MNAMTQPAWARDAAAAFLARYAEMPASLPGEPAVRAAGAEAFRRRGLPGAREEAWHYTSLRPLAEARFFAPVADAAALSERLPAIEAPHLVFANGRFDAALSVLPSRASVRVGTPAYGALARPESEAMVALNTMLAEDGAAIAVAPQTDAGTLLLASLSVGAADHAIGVHPRHAVHLGRGARLTLLEIASGEGGYLHNPVMEITLEEGASLTHLRLQEESAAAFYMGTVYATLAARATYDSFALIVGGRLTRTEVHARLAGEGAVAHLNAAQLLGGTQHADFTTVVTHAAPACASRQTVKNVLAGRARGVFQGRIEVARGAQKTDGYQMNQALLLSPEAEADSKPELEIFADDVKCSHGATVGALDPEQLFYLRSRGIPEAEALAMLVRAFLAEALDPIAHGAGRAMLEVAVERWWEKQAA